jgi:hypothetical protein
MICAGSSGPRVTARPSLTQLRLWVLTTVCVSMLVFRVVTPYLQNHKPLKLNRKFRVTSVLSNHCNQHNPFRETSILSVIQEIPGL